MYSIVDEEILSLGSRFSNPFHMFVKAGHLNSQTVFGLVAKTIARVATPRPAHRVLYRIWRKLGPFKTKIFGGNFFSSDFFLLEFYGCWQCCINGQAESQYENLKTIIVAFNSVPGSS